MYTYAIIPESCVLSSGRWQLLLQTWRSGRQQNKRSSELEDAMVVAACLRHPSRASDVDSVWRHALTSFHPRPLTCFSFVHHFICVLSFVHTFLKQPELWDQKSLMHYLQYVSSKQNVLYIRCYSGYLCDDKDPSKLREMDTARFCMEQKKHGCKL